MKNSVLNHLLLLLLLETEVLSHVDPETKGRIVLIRIIKVSPLMMIIKGYLTQIKDDRIIIYINRERHFIYTFI